MPIDQYGRNINYLRISLTDACNLRCNYCMPADMKFMDEEKLLRDDEIIRLARLFAEVGTTKIRLTGGEPTLRKNLPEIVEALNAIKGIEEVAMTTNALALPDLAQRLKEAGLARVNVSLDSLNPKRFKQITRWGNLSDTLAGIEAAEKAGLPVKINAVIVKGFNDQEDVIELARMTMDKNWQVRFIEMMPLGGIGDFQKENTTYEGELIEKITQAISPPQLLDKGALDGEARMYQLEGAKGQLGFISSVSKPFCDSCNRVRLTADGKLRLCLLKDRELNLMQPVRNGADDESIKKHIMNSIWFKPWGHELDKDIYPANRLMSEIGG